MIPQFKTLRDLDLTVFELAAWADSRNTHYAVALAIHAIASGDRTPAIIWKNPSFVEWDNVKMAVENYVNAGEFPAEEDGRYAWGNETIFVPGTLK